ncbi:MAG: serine/threonine protein kinase [Chloroflexales bacterium]|nr:serine/threonine protein kinase [Chloroflexales bacterium]
MLGADSGDTTLPSPLSAWPDHTTRAPPQGDAPADPPPITPDTLNISAAQTSDSLLPGATLGPGGRYRITGFIGRGGFAETFHALDTQLFDGPCVIKRLRLDLAQPAHIRATQLESLAREAELLVALKTPGHPNIPEVYAYLSDEHCLVMKYVEGVSLQELLNQRGGGLPEDEALRYVHDACSALVYLHARHTLHLDVKPANLLCDSGGRLWLIDFGIGRSVQKPGGAIALGTPGYTPLEQWRGSPEPRSDVYALGVTLYVLLTNHRPTTSGQIAALIGQPGALPPLHQIAPAVRPEVEQLVRRATDPDPAGRGQDGAGRGAGQAFWTPRARLLALLPARGAL